MRGRTWPRRDVTAWARRGSGPTTALRPARPRVAHQRSSRPATPPGRTPRIPQILRRKPPRPDANPWRGKREPQQPVPAGSESPASSTMLQPQGARAAPTDSGGAEPWAIYCLGRPRPFRCVRPATARPRGADCAGIRAPAAPPYAPARVP